MKRSILLVALCFLSLNTVAAEADANAAPNTMSQTAAVEKNAKVDPVALEKMMDQANPMPNMMNLVLENADKLNLNERQKQNLTFWRDSKSMQANHLVEKIIALESELPDDALSGESTRFLINKTSHVLELRMRLASQKVLCRDNMMRVLTPEQWMNAVSLYREQASQ